MVLVATLARKCSSSLDFEAELLPDFVYFKKFFAALQQDAGP
jgi:hypothetical protein